VAELVNLQDRIAGCLIGGAIGDALGFPFEGQSAPKYLLPTQWIISDDTQLTIATCEAIVRHQSVSPEIIATKFATWFREGRIRGMGASTLKALTELAAGGHWALVGRKGEMAAGNGAAMRVAPLGFLLNPAPDADRTLLRDICRITHHSDEAYVGALAVVLAIHSIAIEQHALQPSLLEYIFQQLPDSNVRDRIGEISKAMLEQGIAACGKQFGASAYVAESVPLALAAATLAPTHGFEGVLKAVIECGGDTDTNASIFGQICGTGLGLDRLPRELINHVPDKGKLLELAHDLATMV
jgi:ADP-ribosyl-[dinitrogen reductase] hydrolase